jgi:hypothetical protein
MRGTCLEKAGLDHYGVFKLAPELNGISLGIVPCLSPCMCISATERLAKRWRRVTKMPSFWLIVRYWAVDQAPNPKNSGERGNGVAMRGSRTMCRFDSPPRPCPVMEGAYYGRGSSASTAPRRTALILLAQRPTEHRGGSQPVLDNGYSTEVAAAISEAKTRTRIGRRPRFRIRPPITRLGPPHPEYPPRLIRLPGLHPLTPDEARNDLASRALCLATCCCCCSQRLRPSSGAH